MIKGRVHWRSDEFTLTQEPARVNIRASVGGPVRYPVAMPHLDAATSHTIELKPQVSGSKRGRQRMDTQISCRLQRQRVNDRRIW